jgi:hypothetical protein
MNKSKLTKMYGLCLALVILAPGCRPGSGLEFGEAFHAGAVFSDRVATVRHVFHIANSTSSEINILDKRCSCRCTRSELGKTRLKPGEKTWLLLEVNTPRNLAGIKVSCTLETDYERQKEWPYTLSFYSYPRLSVEPSSVSLSDSRKSAQIRVYQYSEDASDFGPVPVTVSKPSKVSVKINGQPTIDTVRGPAKRATFLADIALADTPERFGDKFETTVSFRSSKDAHASCLVIYQKGLYIKSIPSVAHFGTVDSDDKKLSLLVSSQDRTEFRLIGCRVEGTPDVLRVEGEIGDDCHEKSWHILTLKISRRGIPGHQRAANGRVILTTDAPRQPELAVPWAAIFREGSSPSVSNPGDRIPQPEQ